MVSRPTRKKMYRTMQGRMVDIDQLRAANESVQAVGNMNVNARGDVLGANGQVVTPKAQVIKKYYEQPKGKASEGQSSTKQTPAPQPKAQPTKTATPMAKVETKSKTVSKPKAVPVKTEPLETVKPSTAKKGIDAALDGLE